jgi:hypothetical protein
MQVAVVVLAHLVVLVVLVVLVAAETEAQVGQGAREQQALQIEVAAVVDEQTGTETAVIQAVLELLFLDMQIL